MDGMESRRVLVIDDVKTAADTVSLLLVRMGHEVRTAYDGPSALALADEFHPDVALVDLMMPGMSGVELAGLLRKKRGASVKIIALSAFADRAFAEATKGAGFDGQLIKPATIKTLTDVLGA